MDEKIENNSEKKSKKKRILFWIILLLFLLTGAMIIWVVNSRQKNSAEVDNQTENIATDTANDNQATKDVNDSSSNDESSATIADTANNDKAMVSENYKVTQVKFGGSTIMDNGKPLNLPLEIYQVKSETIISQEDNEPRILITWKTNKEAVSNVNYAKSDGKDAINITEEGYGFEHSMLLKNMEFSTIYTYRIEARDKWGNKFDTEYFSAYTGDKTASIFDLITNAVEDVFGWAMK
ncbi:MAG: hypothetical protein WC682_01360 [Parcubacteria group bacterium]|jgi:hypothetical protein